jgi:hypothetical protein
MGERREGDKRIKGIKERKKNISPYLRRVML